MDTTLPFRHSDRVSPARLAVIAPRADPVLVALTHRVRERPVPTFVLFTRHSDRETGIRHAFRLEQHVQRAYGKTLREMETQMALELLSSSLGVLGLGRFDADLSRRDEGIIVIKHQDSPFPGRFVAVSGGACPILSGFHSAVLTYLSGRTLAAREFSCAGEPQEPCVFIVATEERVSKLTIAVPGTPNHELVAEILNSCRHGATS